MRGGIRDLASIPAQTLELQVGARGMEMVHTLIHMLDMNTGCWCLSLGAVYCPGLVTMDPVSAVVPCSTSHVQGRLLAK